MNCPNCGSYNEPGSRFCMSCGYAIPDAPVQSAATHATSLAKYERRLLAVSTGRLLIALLVLWLFRSILINLSFIEGLRFPDIPFMATEMISIIVSLITLGLLISYMQALNTQWPRAFPRLAALVSVFIAIGYVIVLSLIYTALLPILTQLIDNSTDIILILRVVLLLVAVGLLGWGGLVIYQALPDWLSAIRLSSVAEQEMGLVACLKCGRLNKSNAQHCRSCGNSLSFQSTAPVEPAVE